MLLDTRDCRLLVFLAGDGESVCLSRVIVSNDHVLGKGNCKMRFIPLRWPSSLSHNDSLAACRFRDHLGPIGHKGARLICGCLSVEERVTVDGAKIGCSAKGGVVLHGNHRVNCDNRAIVASCFEDAAGLADGASDLPDRGSTVVDEFVAYTDSVDNTPISLDSVDECLAFALHLMDIKDPQEEGNPFALYGRKDVGNLIAVRAVESNNFITSDLRKIAGYLRG